MCKNISARCPWPNKLLRKRFHHREERWAGKGQTDGEINGTNPVEKKHAMKSQLHNLSPSSKETKVQNSFSKIKCLQSNHYWLVNLLCQTDVMNTINLMLPNSVHSFQLLHCDDSSQASQTSIKTFQTTFQWLSNLRRLVARQLEEKIHQKKWSLLCGKQLLLEGNGSDKKQFAMDPEKNISCCNIPPLSLVGPQLLVTMSMNNLPRVKILQQKNFSSKEICGPTWSYMKISWKYQGYKIKFANLFDFFQ